MKKDILEESLHIDRSFIDLLRKKKVLCLVDGQHYPPVTKWTLSELFKRDVDIKGLIFLGGTEKVENALEELGIEGADYDIFISSEKKKLPIDLIEKAIVEKKPDYVVDLSDEPVLDYHDRFKIGSAVLKHQVKYIGADFILTPPKEHDILKKPSLSIIGTGKRIGKTGVSVTVARTIKHKDFDPVIVCMGRGGPPEADYIDPTKMDMNADTLLHVAEEGGHAASDYWEDALLAQVPTVGCRRCGGGMAGNPFSSNVIKGAQKTNEISQSFVIMEGSGSTFPPIKTDARIVLIGASQPLSNILEYFGQYRIMTSDLAIVTMCEEPMASDRKIEEIEKGIKKLKPDLDIALTVFRPEPLRDISNKDVFMASTAPKKILPKLKEYLEKYYECNVVGISNKLSYRPELRKDLDEGLDQADILLTEIKAASIDVAGMSAKKKDVEIVFMHNKSVLVGGTIADLDDSIMDVCHKAKDRWEES
ncbi:MAG: cyclic 2,3-diphosphoglycerate synthetase [Thermoplasmatota archaeon]